MQANAILLFTPPSSAFPVPPQNPKLSISANPNGIPRWRWPLCSAATGVPRRRWPLCAAAAPAAAPSFPAGGGDLLDISKLGIADQIVTSLSRRGITELFPIQRAVLEPAMEGRDMIGRAITGSGKTLAFGIPILDKIIRQKNQSRRKRVPSALVLAPTRELARQVHREFQVSAPILQSTCIYGGTSIMNQVTALRGGMDIVVGTPGRIIDLVGRGALDLSEVEFVVLDEADQMLAVGFQEDVENILSYLPTKKQCMLFSATMPPWINDLSRKYLRNPLVVDLVGNSDQKLADGITLYSVSSTSPNKQNLLPTLISMYAQGGKSIIFTKTKRDAESLSRSMGVVIGSKALHGDMQQFQRDRTLAAFRDGRFRALVATDVAARGLDIPNVDLVIHFEMPNTPDIFLHRSGRTGRAGNKGTTVLMFTEDQRRSVRFIERDLGCKFEELRGITGQNGKMSSDRYYDDSIGRNLWDSDDDSDDAQDGNYRRFQRPSHSNFRSRGNFGQFNDTHDAKYGNNGRFQRARTSRNSGGNFRSRGGHNRGNNFSKGYQSGPAHLSSTRSARSLPFDNFNQWNENNDYEKFDSHSESSRSESRPGYRKSHQKRSGSDDDNFDFLRDLFGGNQGE